jgi:hypothetical protein
VPSTAKESEILKLILIYIFRGVGDARTWQFETFVGGCHLISDFSMASNGAYRVIDFTKE